MAGTNGVEEEGGFELSFDCWLKALKTAAWDARALSIVERDSRSLETSVPVMIIGWMGAIAIVSEDSRGCCTSARSC